MNSFVEMVLRTTKPSEREVMRWLPKIGTRYSI